MYIKNISLKKAAVSVLVSVMMFSFGACANNTSNSLSAIKLTESERSWSNPDTKYAELIKKYGDSSLPGTMAVATDKDILYLYAEKETEKDGKTLESQDTV